MISVFGMALVAGGVLTWLLTGATGVVLLVAGALLARAYRRSQAADEMHRGKLWQKVLMIIAFLWGGGCVLLSLVVALLW